MPLNNADRLALTKVLDFRLSLTRKSTPKLLPLSLYSSELKGTAQIAGHLRMIRDEGRISDNEVARDRYFNSLRNQGLVDGSATSPKLEPLANLYLDRLDQGANNEFWQGDGGNSVELEVIRHLALLLQKGSPTSSAFREAWYGAQTFFDYVPEDELPAVLADREKLLFLFRINSNGWEIARYFRLDDNERKKFEEAFKKIDQATPAELTAPIELAAAQYKVAASKIQSDVRFRISGFLNAYNQLKSALGSAFPRLDRQLLLRSGAIDATNTTGGGSTKGTSPPSEAVPLAPRLPHPHQLIVTGCPGSGKSFYIDQLAKSADQVIRTQFHPESSFFDFVGTYKPQPVYEPFDASAPLEEGDGVVGTRGKPFIDYRYVPGPLMRGLSQALLHPDQNVVVVIEEINRGNAAAVLGDVLQLLDRQEDGQSRYEIAATPEQRTYFSSLGCPRETIRLPSNLYLWATMNSADQGVFPLDTAFRRRWNYIYKGYSEPCAYPVEHAELRYGGQRYNWDAFRAALNEHLVSQGIHEDKLIGPYFLTVEQLTSPESILEKLFLYLWDDVLRFRQEGLFSAKSFSAVGSSWATGSGNPLSGLKLPDPLPSLDVASAGPAPNNSDPTTSEA